MSQKVLLPSVFLILLGIAVAIFWRDIVSLNPRRFGDCQSQIGDAKKTCLDTVLRKMKDRATWTREATQDLHRESRWTTLAFSAVSVGSIAAVPKLYMQCTDGWAEVGVDWGLILPEQRELRPVESMIFLKYGIDEIPRIKDYWRLSDDRRSVTSRTSTALLRDIAGHDTLMFGIEGDGLQWLFAHFTLTGLDAVVSDLKSRCRTTLLPA